MKKNFVKIIVCTISFLSISFSVFSQSLDQAKNLYNDGEYEEAKPVFEKLVKQSPNNSSYNQWYGVCCYETGDMEGAEKHLLVANKRKVMESYRYLAQIYTKTYRFDEAIEMWEGFILMQNKKKEDTAESETKLEQVKNLLRMEEKTEDVQVIDSIVIDKNSFLEAYNLSSESGNLTTYNDFFKTNGNNQATVYTNQKNNKIYYARPSDDGVYALYSQSKLLDTWGDEKLLLQNNNADNNYPFMLSDGITMYFASKGNESIGGYDIFVTRYNTNTNTFLTPEQMGMPYNSPANDYMMVIDETKNLGWFVSDRNQPEDKVCVYLFIPDASRKRIEDIEDPNILKQRASLSSIKDTWVENANYTDLIKLAHTESTNKDIKKAHDFEFIINDKITYYTLNDIKNPEAKELYKEVINMKKQISSTQKKLEEMRASFTNGNSSVKEQLKPSIMQYENQLYEKMENISIQEKKARNAENRQLGLKK